MKSEAYHPVGDHAPDFHLRDGEREVRRKPERETERMRGIVRKALSREKHPVVEDPRAPQKRPVKAAGEPRDQACGDPVREPPDDVCEHRPQKKRYPGGYLFALLGARLRLAAAGARQELLVQGRAVGVVATTPAEDRVSAHIGRGHRYRRRTAAGALQRNQGDHRAVDGRGNRSGEALYRHQDLAVGVGLNHRYVLRGPARRGVCDFAAPEVGQRRAGGTLEHLGNRGAACARSQDHFGYLRPVAVVLIRRECYCGQNADDRNHDHQLDQGKALLNRSHEYSFSARRYGAWVGRSKSHAAFGAVDLLHCFYEILCHFLSVIWHRKKGVRSKMRHSLTLNVTAAPRRIGPSQRHFATSARKVSRARIGAISSKRTWRSAAMRLRVRSRYSSSR